MPAVALLAVLTACDGDPGGDAPDVAAAGAQRGDPSDVRSPPARRGGPPNILVILADDLGYRDLSYNGATEIETPNIDRLAREGIVFSDGYVADPICAPSRAGLMTGRYPARFGMEVNLTYAPADPHHGLPPEETVFAARLKRAGYRTGMVGKWHLGAAPPFHPLNRGFDSYYGFLGGGHDYFRTDAVGHVNADGQPDYEYLVPLGQDRGLTSFTGYLTDRFTDQAIAFATEDRDRPFFLYLSYNAPHAPLQAPEEIVRKYRHVGDDRRRTYLAMVDALDRNVGRLVAALESSGQWHDTVTFFLSDNGGQLLHGGADNAPLRSGKSSLHEGGIRVPFLASWPARWPQGRTFEPMVVSLDVAATALAVSGAGADPARPLDGVNLDPFIRGAASGPPHEALFWRQVGGPASRPAARFAVRVGDLKLVRDDFEGEAALFDVRTDPGETRDVFSGASGTAERLSALWNDWNLRNVSARVFPWMTDYRRTIGRARAGLYYSMRNRAEVAPVFRIGKEPFRRTTPPPAAPILLRAAPDNGSIALSWADPGDPGIIGYQFRLKSSGDRDWRNWRDVEFWWEANRVRLTGLGNGVTYRVQLRAANGGGWGPPGETSATPRTQKP